MNNKTPVSLASTENRGNFVVTQTHLSRIAQKSLSVLCRVYIHSRTRKLKRAHGVLNAILVNCVKGKRKASHEVASR